MPLALGPRWRGRTSPPPPQTHILEGGCPYLDRVASGEAGQARQNRHCLRSVAKRGGGVGRENSPLVRGHPLACWRERAPPPRCCDSAGPTAPRSHSPQHTPSDAVVVGGCGGLCHVDVGVDSFLSAPSDPPWRCGAFTDSPAGAGVPPPLPPPRPAAVGVAWAGRLRTRRGWVGDTLLVVRGVSHERLSPRPPPPLFPSFSPLAPLDGILPRLLLGAEPCRAVWLTRTGASGEGWGEFVRGWQGRAVRRARLPLGCTRLRLACTCASLEGGSGGWMVGCGIGPGRARHLAGTALLPCSGPASGSCASAPTVELGVTGRLSDHYR